MKPIAIISNSIRGVKRITAEVLALIHCNDGYFRQTPVPAINSVPGGTTFTPYGPDVFAWFVDQPPLNGSPGSYTNADDPGVLHSNTKFDFPGQFCLEGYFMPAGFGGTCMEIADGDAWNETGVSFLSFYTYETSEDSTNTYVQTAIWGKTVGGSVVHFDSGATWAINKNDINLIQHIAFYRDEANYVYVAMNGVQRSKSNVPFPGTISGYVNLAGGYDQNTGTITKGGHRIKFTEFRVTRGASVYGPPPFTAPSTRFSYP